MPWTKKNYPNSMKNLEEEVREKAIEIANRLVEEEYEEGRAISIATSKAKEWYENRGYESSSDITHHLVPDIGTWVFKALEGDERETFDTKEEAMDKIKEVSQKKAIKVMIHDANGKFQKIY